MNYDRKVIEAYALYTPVKLIDFENNEYKGWLVPKDNEYLILPFDKGTTYYFKISHIKAIYHLTNGVRIPKKLRN